MRTYRRFDDQFLGAQYHTTPIDCPIFTLIRTGKNYLENDIKWFNIILIRISTLFLAITLFFNTIYGKHSLKHTTYLFKVYCCSNAVDAMPILMRIRKCQSAEFRIVVKFMLFQEYLLKLYRDKTMPTVAHINKWLFCIACERKRRIDNQVVYKGTHFAPMWHKHTKRNSYHCYFKCSNFILVAFRMHTFQRNSCLRRKHKNEIWFLSISIHVRRYNGVCVCSFWHRQVSQTNINLSTSKRQIWMHTFLLREVPIAINSLC